jgi:hypothetical protein
MMLQVHRPQLTLCFTDPRDQRGQAAGRNPALDKLPIQRTFVRCGMRWGIAALTLLLASVAVAQHHDGHSPYAVLQQKFFAPGAA